MGADLLLLGKALFAAAGFGAGFRLAQMALREGGLPTHTWGSGIIFAGGVGLVGYGLAPLLASSHPALASVTLGLSDGLERLALVGLGVFLWRVFGPASRARQLALAAVVIVLAADWIALLLHQQWPDTALPMPLAVLTHVAFAVPLLWSAFETGIQSVRYRRRLALGLADPVATHRFLLWMLGSAGLASICLLTALGNALSFYSVDSAHSAWEPWLVAVRVLLHLATAALVALGFFPPNGYERWLVRRSETATR